MAVIKAIKSAKTSRKAPKIVKKRTKTFFRFQSDRFDRVKVCTINMLCFFILLDELEKTSRY